MKRKFIKAFAIFLVLNILAGYCWVGDFANEIIAAAATSTASLTAQSTEWIVGDTVSVTMTISCTEDLGYIKYNIQYDAKKLQYMPSGVEGGNGNIGTLVDTGKEQKTFSETFKFTVIESGSCSISFVKSECMFLTMETVEDTAPSATYTNLTLSLSDMQKSSNCNLKSISPSVGSISPSFSKDITEYTINVPAGTKVCYIDCSVEDKTATFKLSGNEYLNVGENKRTCTVTAADGTTKVYTINVVRPQDSTPTPTAKPTEKPAEPTATTPTETEEAESSESIEPITTEVPENTEVPEEPALGDVYIGENKFTIYNITDYLKNKNKTLDIKQSQNFLFGDTVINGIRAYDSNQIQYLVLAEKNDGAKSVYVFDTQELTYQEYLGDSSRLLTAFDVINSGVLETPSTEVTDAIVTENTPTPTAENKKVTEKDGMAAIYVVIGVLVATIAVSVIVIINLRDKKEEE